MAVRTQAEILADIAALFADNVSGDINAADLRSVTEDITDTLFANDSEVLISSATASNSASIDFTSGIDSTYTRYRIDFDGVSAVSPSPEMEILTSSNAGVSFDTGASDYKWATVGRHSDGGAVQSQSDADNSYRIGFNASVQNASQDNMGGSLIINNPSNSSYFTTMQGFLVSYRNDLTRVYHVNSAGARAQAAIVDGIRLQLSTSNIASGNFKLYGLGG